jgi:hypothetical protein
MKKGSELSHGIVKKKIPNLLKNCVCAVVVMAVYIIIFKGDLSVTDLEHIFAGVDS